MPEPPTIQGLFGGYLIEIFVSLVIYGVFIAQAYVYALNCTTDPLYLKLTVTCIAVLETLHSIFVVHMTYAYAINSFGNIAGIAGPIVWSTGASVASEMVIVAFVQSIYIRRVFVLSSGNRWLTSLLSFLLVMRLAFGLTGVVMLFIVDTWEGFRTNLGPFFSVTMGLTLSAVMDLSIVITLIYYLWRHKTGIARTDGLVHRLMAYCVNTGLLTMICSMVAMFTFAFVKSSLLFVGFVQLSSKLYANSLLGTLNARAALSEFASKPMGASELVVRVREPRGSSTAIASSPRHIEIFRETSRIVAGESVVSHQDDDRSSPFKADFVPSTIDEESSPDISFKSHNQQYLN